MSEYEKVDTDCEVQKIDKNMIEFLYESKYIFCTLVVCCKDKVLLLLMFTDTI